MPPAYVKPYVKRQKNDATDAEAICETVSRPNMQFVETKTAEQQSCVIYISATSPPAPWRGYAVARHVLSLVEGVETSNDGQPEITREGRTFPIAEGWQPAKLSESLRDEACLRVRLGRSNRCRQRAGFFGSTERKP